MTSSKKTAFTKYFLIFAAVLAAVAVTCSAGCILSPEDPEKWTPAITQLTDYPEYNLYLAEYTHDDKLDDLLAEQITDAGMLSARIAELCAPGENVRIKRPVPGCTVFLSYENPASAGQFLVGRNFDFSDTSCILVHTVPDNGYESIAFADINMYASDPAGDPANAGEALVSPYLCMDGLNEAGVFIAVLAADGPAVHQNTGKPTATAPFFIRLVLDKAADADEAVALMSQYDANFTSGFQYYIADKSGKTAVVNYIHDEMTVTYDEKILTNFYLCPVPEDYPAGHGQDRYETVETMLDAVLYETDTAKAFDILEASAQIPEMETLGTTQWSVVYHLGTGTADAVFQRHWNDIIDTSLSKTPSAVFA
ncbi:MAG: linear amide C-N hydrolase [Methanocorpusculum sp.]|nr:linear amide C-N hydrolase [Methanocorpusculum sp.]